MNNKVINALRDEYLTDPIVHAHLNMLRYGQATEIDVLISLVKDLSRANRENLERINDMMKNSPMPVFMVKTPAVSG